VLHHFFTEALVRSAIPPRRSNANAIVANFSGNASFLRDLFQRLWNNFDGGIANLRYLLYMPTFFQALLLLWFGKSTSTTYQSADTICVVVQMLFLMLGRNFPGKIREVIKLAQIDTAISIRWMCHRCFKIYDFKDLSTVVNGLKVPQHCWHQEFPNQRRCGEELMTLARNRSGESRGLRVLMSQQLIVPGAQYFISFVDFSAFFCCRYCASAAQHS
jgi:hypothetical protein